ncbi:MAG: cytidine deaminase [Ktedonobacterales bacterium]|nr:cytidine deaminase [Ktedonobacterales bacterium]
MEREALLAAARQAAHQAYAPYSRFRVGAAVVVETPDGPRVAIGANVENASFGLTLCAERAALAAACLLVAPAEGDASPRQPPRITHVAIACVDASDDGSPGERMPCGACRQWLAELAPAAVYYVDGVERALRLDDLLPMAFRLGE